VLSEGRRKFVEVNLCLFISLMSHVCVEREREREKGRDRERERERAHLPA
jgi:hypothetical protein